MSDAPLPDGWTRRRLLDVATLPTGQVDPLAIPYRDQILIAPDHVEPGTGRLLTRQTAAEQGAISGKYPVEPGDVVLSKIRPALRKVVQSDLVGLCSADMYPLRPTPEILPSYLHAVLLGDEFSAFADSVSGRSGIPKINRKELGEFFVDLPPLGVQERIVAALDSLLESIRALENLLGKLREVDHACVRDFFETGQGGRVLWPHVALGDVAEISGGVALGGHVAGPGTEELPYLRVANVHDGYFDVTNVKTMRVRKVDVSRFLLRKGDMLMTEGGDFDKLGRGAVWDGRIDPCLHQNHIFRVRCDRTRVLPEFLGIYSASLYGRRWFANISKQTTNLASISMSQLKSFPVPCPPVADQASIVRRLGVIRTRAESIKGELVKLRDVKEGLMADLLGGRVRAAISDIAHL